MLTHTLWRKLFPDDCKLADKELNNTLYDLLHRSEWKSAVDFGMFGLQKPMLVQTEDIMRRIRIINTAIALKNLSKAEDALKLIEKEDWTAALREFHLASAVIREDFVDAGLIMFSIGKNGEIVDQLAYHEWPLFNQFREHAEFHEAYQKIYGIPFLRKATEEAIKQTAAIERNLQSDKANGASAGDPDHGPF